MPAALSIRFLEMGIAGNRKCMPVPLLTGSSIWLLHAVLVRAMCSCDALGREQAIGAIRADFNDDNAIFTAISTF